MSKYELVKEWIRSEGMDPDLMNDAQLYMLSKTTSFQLWHFSRSWRELVKELKRLTNKNK